MSWAAINSTFHTVDGEDVWEDFVDQAEGSHLSRTYDVAGFYMGGLRCDSGQRRNS